MFAESCPQTFESLLNIIEYSEGRPSRDLFCPLSEQLEQNRELIIIHSKQLSRIRIKFGLGKIFPRTEVKVKALADQVRN